MEKATGDARGRYFKTFSKSASTKKTLFFSVPASPCVPSLYNLEYILDLKFIKTFIFNLYVYVMNIYFYSYVHVYIYFGFFGNDWKWHAWHAWHAQKWKICKTLSTKATLFFSMSGVSCVSEILKPTILTIYKIYIIPINLYNWLC